MQPNRSVQSSVKSTELTNLPKTTKQIRQSIMIGFDLDLIFQVHFGLVSWQILEILIGNQPIQLNIFICLLILDTLVNNNSIVNTMYIPVDF